MSRNQNKQGKDKNFRSRSRTNTSTERGRKKDFEAKEDAAKYNKKGSGSDCASGRGRDRSDYRNDGRNDISWYTRNPNLSLAAAQFPYPYRPGMSLPLSDSVKWTIPGVLSLSWIPTVGNTVSAQDPASIVAKEIYAKVRQSYSGSLEADAPDFVMYLMALDSVYAYIAWLKRVYRCLNAYTPDNYQMPHAVLLAMGLDEAGIQKLRQEKMQLWQTINTLVLSSRKFSCPALMDIMNRHYWMSDNIYSDADGLNSQLYIFNPAAYFIYSEVEIPGDPNKNTAAGLKYKLAPTSIDFSSNGLYIYGEQMLNALVAWDDAYTISGYLMRAYDGVPSFTVEELPIDAMAEIVYSAEVLTQIENSRCVVSGASIDITSEQVAQNPLNNTVVMNNTFAYVSSWTTSPAIEFLSKQNHLITIRSDAPTAADNIIATRLHVAEVLLTSESTKYVHVMCGTEIPLYWTFVSVDQETGDTVNSKLDIYFTVNNSGTINAGARAFMPYRMGLTQFDWQPTTWAIFTDSTGAVAQAVPMCDLHNSTIVSQDVLFNLHRVCIFSEFNAFNY